MLPSTQTSVFMDSESPLWATCQMMPLRFSLPLKPLMIRGMSRFRTGADIACLFPAYVAFGMLKHLVPLRSLARWAWHHPTGERDREAERRLIAGVLRLSQVVGKGDHDCFQRSLL